MKKSVLIAGVFASLVFLINCDSSSSRHVKALMPAKKQDYSNLPPCTSSVATLAASRTKIVDDLNKKITEAKKGEVTSDMKAALTAAIDSLRTKSNELYKEIRAIKGNPEGCNSVTSDSKKLQIVIERMKEENARLGKSVAELTGQSNLLANSSAENDATTLIENQRYEFKAELSEKMNKNKIDRLIVKDGKVSESTSTDDQLKALADNPESEYCYLNSSSDETDAKTNFTILKLAHKPSEDEKSVTSRLIFVSESGQLNSFICRTKPLEVPTKLRTLFGELIILKNGVGAAGDVSTAH